MSTPSLNINILGAGIAGVATAIPLAHAGHTVTIFESRDALREVGAGLQIQSNATRILHAWGLDKALRPLANKPGVLRVLRYEDDSVIGEVAHNPIQEWEYGFPHWNLYRPDLHRVLLKAAVEAGAEVKFGCRAVGANVEQGVIEFADGSKAGDADLVVVADGILSTIRELLPGNESAKAASCGEFCFRAAIDKANMDDDPETAELMKSNDCSVWCGPGTLVLGFGSAGRKVNEPADVQEARDMVQGFSPVVRKVWDRVTETVKWTLAEVQGVTSYVGDSGKVVLLGDAAHAMVPHGGQGAAMALEDAAALSVFVKHARSPAMLPGLMHAWQDFRMSRVEHMRRVSYGNQSWMSLPDGPEQTERDDLWSSMTKRWKEELAQLGEEGFKAKQRPDAVPGEDVRTPESRQWMCGYDIFSEAEKFAHQHACVACGSAAWEASSS